MAPAAQTRRDRVFSGTTVTFANERDEEVTVTIGGVDEASLAAGEMGIGSPAALAMLGAGVGDAVPVRTPAGTTSLEILAIRYPEPHGPEALARDGSSGVSA